MTELLQLAFSALNVATAALDGIQKLRTAEATGDQAVIDAARKEAEDLDNDLSDRLRRIKSGPG